MPCGISLWTKTLSGSCWLHLGRAAVLSTNLKQPGPSQNQLMSFQKQHDQTRRLQSIPTLGCGEFLLNTWSTLWSHVLRQNLQRQMGGSMHYLRVYSISSSDVGKKASLIFSVSRLLQHCANGGTTSRPEFWNSHLCLQSLQNCLLQIGWAHKSTRLASGCKHKAWDCSLSCTLDLHYDWKVWTGFAQHCSLWRVNRILSASHATWRIMAVSSKSRKSEVSEVFPNLGTRLTWMDPSISVVHLTCLQQGETQKASRMNVALIPREKQLWQNSCEAYLSREIKLSPFSLHSDLAFSTAFPLLLMP